ncbi:hypothetical protein [Actinoplanes sp. GCM10030250]|uniref:hypothetical protein n=1 Tax=Actinoplanes sp. GCM10030250 TaxID=3273376 RepID=UPI003622C343
MDLPKPATSRRRLSGVGNHTSVQSLPPESPLHDRGDPGVISRQPQVLDHAVGHLLLVQQRRQCHFAAGGDVPRQ